MMMTMAHEDDKRLEARHKSCPPTRRSAHHSPLLTAPVDQPPHILNQLGRPGRGGQKNQKAIRLQSGLNQQEQITTINSRSNEESVQRVRGSSRWRGGGGTDNGENKGDRGRKKKQKWSAHPRRSFIFSFRIRRSQKGGIQNFYFYLHFQSLLISDFPN